MKIVYVLILGVFIGSASIIYKKGEESVEHMLIDSLRDHEREVNQLLNVAIAYNNSIRDQFIANLDLNNDEYIHPLTYQLKDFPHLGSYGLDGSELINNLPYNASLSGSGSLKDLDNSIIREIDSALALSLSAPLDAGDHKFVWSYYTSKNDFILIAPSVGIKNFQFTEELYKKPFWSIATPDSNSERKVVISDLYDDAVGQGLMLSISSPVYRGDEFKGVVSLDVGLSYLVEVLNHAPISLHDNLSIITKEGNVAATKTDKPLGTIEFNINEDTNGYQLSEYASGYYMLSNLIKDKFYTVYQLSNSDLKLFVFKQIYFQLLVLFLFLAILLLLAKLLQMLSITKKLAEYDGLSQLYNRMTLEKLSNDIFQSSIGKDSPISVAIIDIDHFKKLNDVYGHHVGDLGISHVASIIQNSVRKTDIVGRYGGEEFVVTMPNTSIEQAGILAERTRKNIEDAVFDTDKKVTASMGVAESHSLGIDSFQELCKKSDLALYKAKQDGRNRVVTYHPDLEEVNQRIE